MRNPFLATLDQRPLLCDGAMGTLLHERGVPAGVCLMPSFGRFDVAAELAASIKR